MEKKDFYDYAVKSNLTGTQYQNEEVMKMRDNRLKSESAKVIETASKFAEYKGVDENNVDKSTGEVIDNKK